jgi:phage shock protein A
MAWLDRFSLVMTSSITTLREKFEDPERMLHQLIVDMDDELESVRRSVALAIADEIQLRKRAEKSRQEVETWQERAAAALKRGEEVTAQAAIEQRILSAERAESLGEEHEKQKTQTAKLQQAVRDLEDQIRQAQQKRTLLLARLARANSAQRINDALDRTGNRSAFAQFRRLEDRVDRAEAMSEAYERLDGRDPDADELAQSLAAAERKAQALSEFEALKRRIAEQLE